MSFASIEFAVFFVVVLCGSAVLQKLQKTRIEQCFLLLASYIFYGFWDYRFCALLFFVSLTAYLTAKKADNKVLFAIGVTTPLAVLGVFKYFNFFLSSLASLIGKDIGTLSILLPVGISFYTFQALSYVIDVRRKKSEAESDFIKVALYISFFPQLVAGPIVKASDFMPQLSENRKITKEGLLKGAQLMVFGFVKKIVLADHMSVFVDDVFHSPSAFHRVTLILGVVAYSLQIYFDFSGYSDIAIGCAKCLGYDFLPNFDLPYLSENITVFWRRWHISLSTWLKEYLYIPLGGNRKGKARRYINLMLTMILGGLWHGASWTFVFWGTLHGLALVLDKIRPHRWDNSKVFKVFSTLLTYAFVCIAWVFFRADTFGTATAILRGIFIGQDGIIQNFVWVYISIAALLIATTCALCKAKKEKSPVVHGYYPIVNLRSIPGLVLFFTVIGLMIALAFTGEAPFVYFRF